MKRWDWKVSVLFSEGSLKSKSVHLAQNNKVRKTDKQVANIYCIPWSICFLLQILSIGTLVTVVFCSY